MANSSDQDLPFILELVEEHTEGISRADIQELYAKRRGEEVPRRTLQRWLALLIEQGRIEVEGAGRATRYRPVEAAPSSTAEVEREEGYVTMSPTGADVRRLVRRPLTDRTPVGYHPELLLDYVPGETWYLSCADRERLHELGRTPVGEQPAGTYAREILDRLLIDLSWASSQLEGNTYSLLDTKNLIEYGQRAEGKEAAEAQMILNHKHAIELLVDQAEEVGFNLYTFRNLHAALSENLLDDPADEGRFRKRMVQIAGSVYTPLGVPQQIEEFLRLLLEKVAAIPDPFEQAFFVMGQLPYLQPFADVNKRVSRLGANLPLVKYNLCPLSFIDVPLKAYVEGLLGIYELNRVDLLRDVFLWAYERSSRRYKVVRESIGEPDTFRLRYRSEIAEVLRNIIQSGAAPRESTVREAAEACVPAADLDRFVEIAFSELLNLHEGSIARYRLRPTEFRSWRDRWKAR